MHYTLLKTCLKDVFAHKLVFDIDF